MNCEEEIDSPGEKGFFIRESMRVNEEMFFRKVVNKWDETIIVENNLIPKIKFTPNTILELHQFLSLRVESKDLTHTLVDLSCLDIKNNQSVELKVYELQCLTFSSIKNDSNIGFLFLTATDEDKNLLINRCEFLCKIIINKFCYVKINRCNFKGSDKGRKAMALLNFYKCDNVSLKMNYFSFSMVGVSIQNSVCEGIENSFDNLNICYSLSGAGKSVIITKPRTEGVRGCRSKVEKGRHHEEIRLLHNDDELLEKLNAIFDGSYN